MGQQILFIFINSNLLWNEQPKRSSLLNIGNEEPLSFLNQESQCRGGASPPLNINT